MIDVELENDWVNLKSAKALVDEVQQFKDHYFEIHPLNEANEKAERIALKCDSIARKLDALRGGCEEENRAVFSFLYGKCLNITSNYSSVAEDNLSRAVKLNPKLTPAWNELGECLWKKGDVLGAKTCFDGALSQCRNKISLRNLSIVLRQAKSKSCDEQIKNIQEALNKAKEAVEMDVSDGISWSLLGNSYLSSFFNITPNPKTLQLCMAAYHKAEQDPVARMTSDLYYNKAIALKFEEEFQSALAGFQYASLLDPEWYFPMEQHAKLWDYLNKVQDLVITRGRLKAKQYNLMLKNLKPEQLGPYGDGGFTSQTGFKVKLNHVFLSDLAEGPNKEKVIFGKVLCHVYQEDKVPFTFCLADSQENICCVTVYNLAEGKGVIIGDSVAIPEPYYHKVEATNGDKTVKFNSIRVQNPLVLVVNGKRVGKALMASTQLSTFQKAD